MNHAPSVPPCPYNPRVAIIVAPRPRSRFALLTGHQRLAIAQEMGLTTPAVVMGTGKTVWIQPDGTVTEHVRTPRQPERRGKAPSR